MDDGCGKKDPVNTQRNNYFQYFRMSIVSIMLRRLCLLIQMIVLMLPGLLWGQPNRFGVPMITNYPYSVTGGSEQNWCITQDLRGVLYVGNNNKGVLEYDGVEWRIIPVPNDPIIRSLVTSEDGIVYVGAVSEFGYLAPDGMGKIHYVSLSDTIDQEQFTFSSVWRSHYSNGQVYFCTFPYIFIYNEREDELSIMENTEYAFFNFMIDSTLYVSDFGQGLMRLEDSGFATIPGGENFREMSITGLAKYDDTHLLVGTFSQGVHLFDLEEGKIEPDFLEAGLREHLEKGDITYLQPLNEDFVISSLYNGLVILGRNGRAREILREADGLINNDIPFVYSHETLQASGPLWIANYMGVSKLETNNPFRVFTEEAGFKGFIQDIKTFDDKLFISTLGGLFYKESSSTGTRFVPIPEIQNEEVRQLHVFRPNRWTEMLIATTQKATFLLDRNLNVSVLGEQVVNKPENLQEAAEYSGYFLVQDPGDPSKIYTGRSAVVGLQYQGGEWREVMRYSISQDRLLRAGMDKYGFLWITTDLSVLRIDIALMKAATLRRYQRNKGLPANDQNHVFIDPESGEVLLGTRDGFYRYNYFRDTIYRDTLHNAILPPGTNAVHNFYQDHGGDFWYSVENEHLGWIELISSKIDGQFEVIRKNSFQRLINASADVFFSDPERGFWLGKSNELYHFDKSFTRNDTLPFQTLIRSVSVAEDSFLFYGTNYRKNDKGTYTIHTNQTEDAQHSIKYRYNNIEFRWAAPFFEQENELNYSYRLEGFQEHWSGWTPATYKEFTNLPFGPYTLQVKAQNVYGAESLPVTYSFSILRPWYATYPAILIYILLSGLLIYAIIKLYTRRLKQENLRLEGIIEERTAEIRKQKEELTDSIEYASRIQRAMLPSDMLLKENQIEHFILFRPRDIVSGDFYWIGFKNGKLLIVAADCTGHGVPGAFMSMLGMTFLDEIVIKSEITSTEQILEDLREQVITSLKQSGEGTVDSTKDGMDLAVVAIDLTSKEIQYSGAYNPLYLVRKLKKREKEKLKRSEELELPRGSLHDDQNLLIQVRADQMPIGISEKKSSFTSSSFENEGYSVYLFSDGYLDQFGGPKGKKFMSKNFKKLILEVQSLPLGEQGAAMEKVLLGWMGEISQIDDILIIGLRFEDR